MARDETPPFARGETLFNQTAKDPIFADPDNLAGKAFRFEPNSPDGQNTGDPSGRAIICICVKNVSGVNLLPKRLARFKAVAPLECFVDGYVFQTGDHVAGVIDEFLPPQGVPNGDYFWVVTDGPTVLQSSVAVNLGDRIEAATGTDALNADAGKAKLYAGTADVEAITRLGRAEATIGSAGPVAVVVHVPKD